MTLLVGNPKVQYFKTGKLDYLVGGKLYSYISGTTIPKLTYPSMGDALAETNANTNPIILDARGEASVVVKGATTLVLTDELDNVIWSVDGVDLVESDIFDANGNAVLRFIGEEGATNEITISNAPSGESPNISATGGEDDIGLEVSSKGEGDLFLDGGVTGNVEIGSKSAGNIRLRKAVVAYGNVEIKGVSTFTDTLVVDATKTFSVVPAGVVMWKASTVVPPGWLECAGQAVSRTTYPALFADIGTTYGLGDGSTTFNLPNQARRVLMGRGGTGTGVIGNAVSNTGGAETHVLTIPELANHTHLTTSSNDPIQVIVSPGGANVPSYAGTTSVAAGSNAPHNNLQPSLIMMMIIRAY